MMKRKFFRSFLSMVLVILLVTMMIGPAFAAKGGKSQPDEGTSETITLNEGESIEFTYTVSDRNSTGYEWVTSSALGNSILIVAEDNKRNSVSTTFSYTATDSGEDNITVTYKGSVEKVFTETITVLYPTVNTPPSIVLSGAINVVEDSEEGILIASVSDSDNSISDLTLSSTSNNVMVINNQFWYTPSENFNGNETITITAFDGKNSVERTLTVTVTPENDLPVIEPIDDFILTIDKTHTFDVLATDVDDDNLLVEVSAFSGNVSSIDGKYKYKPTVIGTDEITITVDDGTATITKTIKVTVTPINHPPLYTEDVYNLILDEDTSQSITPVFSDEDLDDSHTFDFEYNGSGTIVNLGLGEFRYTPAENYYGTDDFTVKVIDSKGAFDTALVRVEVNPINDAPEMEIIGDVETTVDETFIVTIGSWDVDGDPILYSISDTSNASIDQSGNFSFLASTEGTYYVDVAVTSGTDVITQTITIMVNGDQLIYVALGDSIPSGVLGTGLVGQSYVQQLGQAYDFDLINESVSGYNAIDVINDLLNRTSTINAVTNADVITLCVGANDIMDAAGRTWLGTINKTNINWALADSGRDNFEQNWPLIIEKIYELNPDVTLIAMTLYNPYRRTDSYFDLVNPYFMDTTPGNFGLNHIIKNTEKPNESGQYYVADVYKAFDEHANKDSLTNFYSWLSDPHPNQEGHNEIFRVHDDIMRSMY